MICRCFHDESLHAFGKHPKTKLRVRMGCTAQDGFQFCKCQEFREATGSQIQTGENEMAKEKKARKAKSEGRKPTLAPFVDSPFKIYMTCDGKEREAMVLNSGIIKYKEKEFTSPSGFANAVIKELGAKGRADGWKTVYFNRDGERVMLNTLRGSKSPLALEAPKPRKAKAAAPKKAKSATPRATRKPRAARSKANGSTTAKQDVSDSDVPQNEATA